MTESTGRTPHTEEPAEGEAPGTAGQDEGGRTPHPGQPAEGGVDEAGLAEGLDPENRVTGA